MISDKKLITSRYIDALELVARLFASHQRDMGDVPYVAHLFGVCHIVQQLTDEEDVYIAALLHDVLEDIPAADYSVDQMQKDFGPRVVDIVQTVSIDDSQKSKIEARQKYLQNLKTGPVEACLVSGADLLYNGKDILNWLERQPSKARQVFGGERWARMKWFGGERLKIINSKLGENNLLVCELETMLKELETFL